MDVRKCVFFACTVSALPGLIGVKFLPARWCSDCCTEYALVVGNLLQPPAVGPAAFGVAGLDDALLHLYLESAHPANEGDELLAG